jgi:hypothetical protein
VLSRRFCNRLKTDAPGVVFPFFARKPIDLASLKLCSLVAWIETSQPLLKIAPKFPRRRSGCAGFAYADIEEKVGVYLIQQVVKLIDYSFVGRLFIGGERRCRLEIE